MSDQGFVSVPITTDAPSLADDAVDRLQERWPDWEPNDGDMEVVQIETLAPMAADAAQAASLMFPAAFRAFGTDLYGVPYTNGSPAVTTVTFTFADTAGHDIPAGTEIDIDGFAFTVDTLHTVTAGTDNITGVEVTAAELGSAQNDLVGDVVTPITALAGIESITVEDPTGGGADAEDDIAYQDRLARELQLRAKTLVTTRDFELEALSQAGIGRAVAIADSARHVTVVVTDADGEVVPTPIKDDLVALYADYRQVNTIVTVVDATYTTVNVTYQVRAYPGFDPDDLADRIDAMLGEWLSPAVWGRPTFGDPGSTPTWINDPVVRRLKLVDLIGNVEGVNYVASLSITGSAGTVDGNGDLTMPGSVALPEPGTFAGTGGTKVTMP